MDSGTTGSLRTRVATLEVELAAARRETEQLRDGALFLLSIQSSFTHCQGISNRSCINQETSGLYHEIRRLRLENQSLRDQVAHYSPVDFDYGGSVASEPLIDLFDHPDEVLVVANAHDSMDEKEFPNQETSISYKSNGAAEWESSILEPASRIKDVETHKGTLGTPKSVHTNAPTGHQHMIYDQPMSSNAYPCCAVLISDLPKRTTYSQLLSRVRGGQVLFAQLGDTSRMTGSQTAFIRFVGSESAHKFVESSKENPPLFKTEDDIALSIGRVDFVGTPSAPILPNLMSAINDRGVSRCFSLTPPQGLLKGVDVERVIRKAAGKHRLAHVATSENGAIRVECTGIEAAIQTQAALIYGIFKGSMSCFEKDPCDRLAKGINLDDKEALKAEEPSQHNSHKLTGRPNFKAACNTNEIELIDSLSSSDTCETVRTPQYSTEEDEAEQQQIFRRRVPVRWNVEREIQLAKTTQIVTS